jgi:glucose/arabinose dehydrogenase
MDSSIKEIISQKDYRSVWKKGILFLIVMTLSFYFFGIIPAGSNPLLTESLAQINWPRFSYREATGGLSQPVQITHAGDGSGRIFIVEQGGRIRLLINRQLLAVPFLDISGRVRTLGNEEGLLSLAFPPDYTTKGHFYVYYTNLNGDNVISRFRLSAVPDIADPNSEQVVLTLLHPVNDNHNGGQLAFGPDGFLYVGTGDGGGAGDPDGNAQNPGTLLGKLLRIDVETGNPATYVIPAANPFADPSDGIRDEIWALGLRNPWRFSFDRLTGDLYIGDVGQTTWEEIDFQPAASPGGENFGWNILEGPVCFSPPSGCSPPLNYSSPVAEYDHSLGCSVTGGFVYRGSPVSSLYGVYFYGDYCSGRIWGLKQAGGIWQNQILGQLPPGFNLSTFGEDETGTLYLGSLSNGKIYQINAFSVYLPLLSE